MKKKTDLIEDQLPAVKIRYDGLDAEKHEIDLYEFGKSAQGIAKILATMADFAVTGNINEGRKKQSKIILKETKANCFSFEAFVTIIDNSPILTTIIEENIRGFYTILVAYITAKIAFKNTKKDDAALLKAIEELGRKNDQEKILNSIEKIVLSLCGAAKQTVSPIGITCNTIKFGDSSDHYTVWDEEDKARILDNSFELTPEQEYKVLIDEFDMRKRTCKVALHDDLSVRYNAKITDPEAELVNNKYALAMAKKNIVTVRAQTKIYELKPQEFSISGIKSLEEHLPKQLELPS